MELVWTALHMVSVLFDVQHMRSFLAGLVDDRGATVAVITDFGVVHRSWLANNYMVKPTTRQMTEQNFYCKSKKSGAAENVMRTVLT